MQLDFPSSMWASEASFEAGLREVLQIDDAVGNGPEAPLLQNAALWQAVQVLSKY